MKSSNALCPNQFEEAIKVDEIQNRVVGVFGMMQILSNLTISKRNYQNSLSQVNWPIESWTKSHDLFPGTCLDRVFCKPEKRKCRFIG